MPKWWLTMLHVTSRRMKCVPIMGVQITLASKVKPDADALSWVPDDGKKPSSSSSSRLEHYIHCQDLEKKHWAIIKLKAQLAPKQLECKNFPSRTSPFSNPPSHIRRSQRRSEQMLPHPRTTARPHRKFDIWQVTKKNFMSFSTNRVPQRALPRLNLELSHTSRSFRETLSTRQGEFITQSYFNLGMADYRRQKPCLQEFKNTINEVVLLR